MSCRIITSRTTGKEVQSKTWDDIRKTVESDEKADQLYSQLTTPAFASWFGDWVNDAGGKNVSKVVNEHGEPMVVYHGSKNSFDSFQKNKLGSNTNPIKGEFSQFDDSYLGFHFTEDRSYYTNRHEFGNTLTNNLNEFQCFLNIKNPAEINSKKVFFESNAPHVELQTSDPLVLKAKGYDGVKYDIHSGSGIDGDSFINNYIVFEPNQIKSISNDGSFFSKSDNINFNRPASTETHLEMTVKSQEKMMAREMFDKILQPLADKWNIKMPEVVTPEQAVELTKNAFIPYNGEQGFFINDQSYVLESAINLNNGIHEMMHPFMDSVAASNPELFSKLHKEFTVTNTGAQIAQEVGKTYADMNEVQQQKEIMVRGLTALVQNNIQAGEKEKITGIFNKFWYALKQLFRRAFGATIRIGELGEHTSLQELADMLTGDHFKIETSYISQKDVIQFSRANDAIAKEVEVIDPQKLNSTIDQYFDIISSQLTKVLYQDNYEEVRKIMTAATGRNFLETSKQLLNDVSVLSDDIEDTAKKVNNLTHVIYETKVISEKILDRLREISKEPGDSRDRIQKMSYFEGVLKQWENYYTNLMKDIAVDLPASSELTKTLSLTKTNIESGLAQIEKNNEPGILDMLEDQVSELKKDIAADSAKRMALYEAAQKNGENVDSMIAKEKERIKKFDLSRENLLKYLKGENGDANMFSGMLEAYISSADPIVSSFAKFLNTNMYAIEAAVRNIDVAMRDELAPLYKEGNINRGKVSQLGSQASFLDKRMKIVHEKPEAYMVVTLLNAFKDYQYDVSLINRQIKEARNDKDLLKKLEAEKETMQSIFMNRPYVDEYYAAQDIWKTPDGVIAKKLLNDAYTFINTLEETGGTEADEIEANLVIIKDKLREIQQMGVLTDQFGQPKNEADTKVAKVIQKYKEATKDFHQYDEKVGLFEDRLNQFEEGLEAKGIEKGTAEYKIKRDAYLSENRKITLHESFYKDREKILNSISEILAKLPDNERSKVEMSPLWLNIIEMAKGFRDVDGQIIGSDMTDQKIHEIKKLQEELIKMQASYAKMNGLTVAESDRMSELAAIKKEGNITDEEKAESKELYDKKKSFTSILSLTDKAALTGLFQELSDLQSKEPTDYYLTILNNYLSQNEQSEVTAATADSVLKVMDMEPILDRDPVFKEWFLKNHLVKEKYDAEARERVPYYERLYVWNKILPNDSKYYNTYTLSTGETIFGTPNNEYFKRNVKDKYKTGYDKTTKQVNPIVGVHIDNRGHYLPKSEKEGKKNPLWTDKYINHDYEKLKSSNSPVFRILEVMKKYHLKSQEGADSNNKLWMDVPRFRAHGMEHLQKGHLVGDTKAKAEKIWDSVKTIWTKNNADDFQDGIGNFAQELADRDKAGSIIDNSDMVKVPIKGLAMLEASEVSLDLGGSIMKHIASIETNKQLIKMNPIAAALVNKVQSQGAQMIKDINGNLTYNSGMKQLANDKTNNRAKIITNLYQRDFLGMEHHMELKGFDKAANQIMKVTAFSTLFVNVSGSFKNLFAAQIQGFIESMNGKHINVNEYRKGHTLMMTYIPAMIADYDKLGGHSKETQLMRAFDFVQGGTEEKFGHEYTSATSRNFVTGKMGFFGMKMGEIEAQGAFGLGLMIHQKVAQTVGGVTNQIDLVNAYELVNGKLQLKEGIDEEWAEGGKKFITFKLMAHELSMKLQGNYAKINQAEIQRYTLGRLFNFMRRYFVPSFTNRFSQERMQIGVGSTREGYYWTAVRMFANTFKEHKLNWHLYTEEEKGNFWKTVTEVSISLMFMLLLRALGWNPDDEDKYKKLKDNSWATNHLIYQLMAVKSETEQFIPIGGMGADEIMRFKNTPSIAFGQMDKWYTLLGDCFHPLEETKVRSGFFDKGDNKLLVHVAKIAGFTGNIFTPENGVESLSKSTSRTK